MPAHAQSLIPENPFRLTLAQRLELVSDHCTRCQRCVAGCRYLKKHGDPKTIAAAYDPSDRYFLKMPFECSLCGLCKAVCPGSVDPTAMFLEMRREAVDRGEGKCPEHRGLLAYEKKGTSKRYSWYGFPEGCDTIFFPGCALAGSRSDKTRLVYEHIRKSIPNAGIVLDCCSKPSHDLGREDYSQSMFGELRDYLLAQRIKTVLVACPNCDKMFSEYGQEFETRSVYEYLNEFEIPATSKVSATVIVHDPCVSRFNESAQDAVRQLLHKQGVQVEDTQHNRKTTLCCGEGGAVGCVSPEMSEEWTKKRIAEAEGRHIVTYCAGCSHQLGAHGPTSHILDLVFEQQVAIAGRAKVAKAPLTYLNRLKLKKHFQTHVVAKVSRERTFDAEEPSRRVRLEKLAVLALIITVIVAVRLTGIADYFE